MLKVTGDDDASQQRSRASLGRSNFAQRFGLNNAERTSAVEAILAKIDENDLEVIRVTFVDLHGQVRVRPIEARHFASAARNGVPFSTAFFAMDSANNIFQNIFAKDGGFGRDDGRRRRYAGYP